MDFVTVFMEHSASIWKKQVISSRSEGFSSGAECYALQTADMWEMFTDQAWLEFGKIQVVAKEKTTHQDALIDWSTGSKESGDDLPDNLMLSWLRLGWSLKTEVHTCKHHYLQALTTFTSLTWLPHPWNCSASTKYLFRCWKIYMNCMHALWWACLGFNWHSYISLKMTMTDQSSWWDWSAKWRVLINHVMMLKLKVIPEWNLPTLQSCMSMADSSGSTSGGGYVLLLCSIISLLKPRYGCSCSVYGRVHFHLSTITWNPWLSVWKSVVDNSGSSDISFSYGMLIPIGKNVDHSTIVQFVQHQVRWKALLNQLDVVSANMKQSIAFVKKMIHTKKLQIVQLRADCAAEMVLDNRADLDVRDSLQKKINVFLQQRGSAHADAWTKQAPNTWSIQPINPQLTNPDDQLTGLTSSQPN